jgi:hypothetical protein
VDRAAERLRVGKPEATADPDDKQKAPRLNIEAETRSEQSSIDPAQSRTQTDVGVTLDADETTRVRGGVRVERESEREQGDPIPTVGIEKRF